MKIRNPRLRPGNPYSVRFTGASHPVELHVRRFGELGVEASSLRDGPFALYAWEKITHLERSAP